MKDYHINVSCGDEDEGYIADIPDLRQCSAFGATPEEALGEVLRAKAAWIKAAKAARKPIPYWYEANGIGRKKLKIKRFLE